MINNSTITTMTLKNKIRLQQAELAVRRGAITEVQYQAISDECRDEQAIDTINLATQTEQLPSTSAKKKPAKGKAAATTQTVVAPEVRPSDLSTAHVIDGTPNHPALPGLTTDSNGTVPGNA